MTTFKDIACSKPALYIVQGALAVGTVALETASCLAIDKAITSAYQFGQYCNLQASSTIIPQLGNITCRVLQSTDSYFYALDTILGTSALIAASTLGASFIIKNSSANNAETQKLLNQSDRENEKKVPFYAGAGAIVTGTASFIANRVFTSGAHHATQLAGQCCAVANSTLTNPSCAGVICEAVQNSESLNLTGRIASTVFLCVSATGFVASSIFCKCKSHPILDESDNDDISD
ncbi:MAG: hypothetical protein LLF94_03665 [Chlamydiales bacterium]|nr:hypothetical protein [Chlamydiales bacterium]